MLLDFLVRHIRIYRKQNGCSLKICITKQRHSGRKHNLQCNFTLPAFVVSNNYANPVSFQWIPMGDDRGDLMMFIKQVY